MGRVGRPVETADSTRPSLDAEVLKGLRRRLGRWLKLRREAVGLTQADLAGRLRIRYYSFISQIEGGLGRLPQDLYGEWADALQIPRQAFGLIVLQHLEPGLFRLITAQEPPSPDDPESLIVPGALRLDPVTGARDAADAA